MTTEREKIIAAAKLCGYWSGQTIEVIERFYAIAQASRDAEIAFAQIIVAGFMDRLDALDAKCDELKSARLKTCAQQSPRERRMSLQIEKDTEWNPYAEHEKTIEALRDQLASRDAEVAKLREQVKMLRSSVEQWLDYMGENGHCVCQASKELLQEALAATEPKE